MDRPESRYTTVLGLGVTASQPQHLQAPGSAGWLSKCPRGRMWLMDKDTRNNRRTEAPTNTHAHR